MDALKALSVFSVITFAMSAGLGALAKERDPHSFSNPSEVSVSHVELNLAVDFKSKILRGTATLTLEHHEPTKHLILDAAGLKVQSVKLDGGVQTQFVFGEGRPGFGQPLTVDILPETKTVSIAYETSPGAEALQWLEPEQTANKKHPFLYSQSQSIYARTWVPCQDTPSVRFTYSAKLQVPPGLLAVMSAVNPKRRNIEGLYHFKMPQKIPSYLLALAVGDLEYRSYDGRSGVYAEGQTLKAAHREFKSLPKMMRAAEKLYGPYAWGQYDLLILPPSFPFGGMENPRLSFITPSLLAGDQSLVNVVAHELAHSWTGNLVTNSNINHFWLNEGFTVFAERRIVEALWGVEARELHAKEGETDLLEAIDKLSKKHPEYTVLRMHLAAETNPDDAYSQVPYEKGYLFLRWIEDQVGARKMDDFIRAYISTLKWKAITTEDFVGFLETNLIKGDTKLREKLALKQWLEEPGLPDLRPRIDSIALKRVTEDAQSWLQKGTLKQAAIRKYSTFEWLHFLSLIPKTVTSSQLDALDRVAKLSRSHNAEILFTWIKLGLDARYAASLKLVEPFLGSIGRGKFVNPIFQRLIEREDTLEFARSLYQKLKPGYHAIVRGRIEKLLAGNK